MESMRSLNTSLPSTSAPRRGWKPPEQLLQSFKSAALSVTNLYKSAASEQTAARSAGYQEALEDLLGFLERENIGLGNGEGWRVRQWLAERMERAMPGHTTTDSDDDADDDNKRARSSSPIAEKTNHDRKGSVSSARTTSPSRPGSAPPNVTTFGSTTRLVQPEPSPPSRQRQEFTFRSQYSYPHSSHSSHESDMDTVDPGSVGVPAAVPALRVDVLPRHTRSSHRHNGHGSRLSSRTSSGVLGSGAGAKRRFPFGDYFDISGIGRDFPGGPPKRGRYS